MKLRHYIVVFVVAFAFSAFLASCLNEENRIPPNCYDLILNNGEEKIDCGGPNCTECDHCTNGVRDEDRGETWIDCGGECGPCPACSNGILDPGELGIDCGGANCGDCADLCNNGLLDGLETEVDCGSVYCIACPTCTDGIINGGEIGIDCGNGECPNCESAANCINGTWQQSSELYLDCGGPDCYDCDTVLTWKINGTTYTCLDDMIIYTADESTMSISGTATDGTQIAFSIDITPGIITTGSSVVINPDSEAGNVAAVNVVGEPLPYLHSFEGASFTINVGLARFNWNPGGWTLTQENILVGSFGGQLVNSSGEEVNVTNGSFKVAW